MKINQENCQTLVLEGLLILAQRAMSKSAWEEVGLNAKPGSEIALKAV